MGHTNYNNRAFQLIGRLYKEHVSAYLRYIVLAVVFMVIAAICTALVVHLIQPTIDMVFVAKDVDLLFILPLLMMMIVGVKGAAEYMQSYLVRVVGQSVLIDLQIRLYNHLLHSDISLVQNESSGKLISRFTNDIMLIKGSASHILVSIAKHLISIIFLLFVMIKMEPVLSIVGLAAFPLAIYPIHRISKKMRKTVLATQEQMADYTARLDETFMGIKVIKSFTAEKYEVDKSQAMLGKMFKLYKTAIISDSLTSPIMELISGISTALIILLGGYQIIYSNSTAGEVFAFMTAFLSAYRPFKSLLSLNMNLQEGIAATSRVFAMLDTHPQIVDSPNAVTLSEPISRVEFRDVCFSVGQSDILHNISFDVQRGDSAIICGHSGCGKTTVANLLLRFIDATSGKIMINGVDIKDISIESLRKHIGFVSQDILLFDETIKRNILYNNHADHKEIEHAAKMACAAEFIESAPGKYDAEIGFQGFRLSGGQRQRLCIVRALIKNASLLILDEATSNLDEANEMNILNNIRSINKDAILIIITHRNTVIKKFDKIIRMSGGRIEFCN